MGIGRFTELAQAWGADRARWPDHERALYDRFASSEQGMAILADAERVDHFLAAWQPPLDDDEARVARIVAAAGRDAPLPATRGLRVPPAPRHRYGAWLSGGFAASALLGFVLGFTQADTVQEDPAYAELLLGNTSAMEEFQ